MAYIGTSEIPFGDFFETGQEQLSPFLTREARRWGVNLSLKAALLAAFLLALSYTLFWIYPEKPYINLLLLFVYFLAGVPALIESLKDLVSFQINIDILMTIAAFGSVVIGSPLEGGLLLVLFAISGAMEDTVTKKAKASINSLHKLSPTKALVQTAEGGYLQRALSEVKPGWKILVRSGQVVPLDGEVLEGASSVSLVHLTGESRPVAKKVADLVPAGAINLEGALLIRVTHTTQDSTLARIIKLVTEAQEAKPQLQRWFDSVSEGYAKTIIALSFLFAIAFSWGFDFPFLGKEGSIYRSLSFLIAASPCALIIAIPIAYLSATSACAKNGILLKGGITLDALASCQTIAFDKTGTLTTGELVCLDFESLDVGNLPSKEALNLAFSLEQNAYHPIADAIVKYALEHGGGKVEISSFKSIPGYGVEAFYGTVPIALGSVEFIEPKIDPQTAHLLKKKVDLLKSQGEILAIFVFGKNPFLFRFQDAIRSGIKESLVELKEKGYHLMMLSGDYLESAKRVASHLGIEDVQANLKPEDKLELVSQKAEKGLIMVGDGVNDAPALARATVGISMGKIGSSAAIEAADVILLQDHLDKLPWLMQKAKTTKKIVTQNLTIAALAIFIASLPALAGFIPLWLAVVLHEGGTVIVGLNGLRLLKK